MAAVGGQQHVRRCRNGGGRHADTEKREAKKSGRHAVEGTARRAGRRRHTSDLSVGSLTRSLAVIVFTGTVLLACSSSSKRVAVSPKTAAEVKALLTAGTKAQQAGDSVTAGNDYTEALRYYDMALANDPLFTQALFNKAILVASTNPNQAITLYGRVVSQAQSNVTTGAYFNLGLLLVGQHHTSEGQVNINEALRRDPSLSSRIPADVKQALTTPPPAGIRTGQSSDEKRP
jgi:tetratricopeptide (TPR) repeat protein